VNYWGSLTEPKIPIQKVQFYAGDVTGGSAPDHFPDSYLFGVDASRILQYFVQHGNPTWPKGNLWTFSPSGTIDHNGIIPQTGAPIPITVGTTPLSVDIYGLSVGDYNGSFVFTGKKESASTSLFLTYGTTKVVKSGDVFDLPIYTQSSIDVGAVSLIMNFPADKLEILGVTLGDQANTPMSFNVSGNELTIGWYSRDDLSLVAGDKLLTLKVKLVGSLGDNETVRFALAENPLNELADAFASVINDAVLNIDVIGTKAVGIEPTPSSDGLRFGNYPNPFNGTTTFTYSLPVAGNVTIELRDMLGVMVKVVADKLSQTSGDHKLIMDANDLPTGVFTATLKLSSANEPMTRTIKIVRTH
jgi:hypothetical protein